MNKKKERVFVVRVVMNEDDYKVLKNNYKLKDSEIRERLRMHANISVDAIISDVCSEWKEKYDYGDD